MDENEHKRLSNTTLKHKIKGYNSTFVFSSPVRSTEELMLSPVHRRRRRRRPMLTSAFRSNVDKLLDPG